MKSFNKFSPLIALAFLAFSCGPKDEIAAKHAELEELKAQSNEISTSIAELEAELTKLDPEFAKQNKKSVLITTAEAKKGEFDHYVEVTGSVLSKKNVMISAETSGRILEIPVLEGMRVTKGTVMARIDSESLQRNIDELENSLELATTLFEKQERLWNQQIGTEVQYLEAKNRKEGLERNLATAKTNLAKAVITAPFSGTLESIEVRLGELVQPGMGMFQFVGESDLFIEADISESYIGVLSKGDSVEVNFPSINKELQTKVSSIGAIINPNNRTFKVEVYLPNLPMVKPNMISVLKILDYQNANAVVVPSHLILSDNRGDYVFVVEDGKALKKYVERGKTFDRETEILSGLKGGETLVDKGFREVGDNFNVNIAQQ
ncbi:efflux RND transporter periplasmic adaptor subunit [Algoriphagus halophytocola]|uniref:Efflux RND transporter periplasmic adaptor subunit n=1 Tax=Algoriphagus halophytocola TaxID=2991499 RepID=A0ABY6MGM5_9BACT|nr:MULTISPECIES: efflux RND transporter periplasmic adaptor subunit [unclassified Algoriphagus]UZD22609.1 efflux RND transporter periplasmic adaptor subunit [Algoriphagus sp. TR-M5]WBL43875.1 efflux RND transporter periplasmic adaptor subunit [Algoriphagus sp. TR-M9]